jgi:hypothetical protein
MSDIAMKWQEALRYSQIGVAERPCVRDAREPWRVVSWISRQKNHCLRVLNGRGKVGSRRRRHRFTSTKQASRYDDWEPVKPYPPMKLLAIAAQLEDEALGLTN